MSKFIALRVSGDEITFYHTKEKFILSLTGNSEFITPHAQRERGLSDWGWCPYIYIYVCGWKKYLNRTLVIDSPFQTFAVGLLVKFID